MFFNDSASTDRLRVVGGRNAGKEGIYSDAAVQSVRQSRPYHHLDQEGRWNSVMYGV